MPELVARTRRLDGDPDLVALAGRSGIVFERGRAGLAGRGVAARCSVDDAPGVLAAVDVDDEVGLPGCGPVAFGALPFLPHRVAASEVVVPEVAWGRSEDGSRWVTTIGPPGTEPPVPDEAAAAAA
ncbi:MAG: hypothetical protein ACRD0G_12470, partial [Acidimicrobiales bacterium]